MNIFSSLEEGQKAARLRVLALFRSTGDLPAIQRRFCSCNHVYWNLIALFRFWELCKQLNMIKFINNYP